MRFCYTLFLLLFLFIAQPAIPQDTPKEPKACRSVHLFYPAPEGTVFYNEMVVDESHTGSYFMACGFRHGYFGIQEIRNKKDKVVIFSVWDPGKQNDPNSVEEDRQVQVLHEGDGVNVSRFGNEGTGGKSMFPYPWKIGETYKFMVQAKPDGKRTVYSGYFYLNEEKRWKHLVSFSTLAGNDLLKGYYSFVEDFWRNGKSAKQIHKARYGNGWVYTKENHWVALTRAVFSADRTTLTNNINAGLAEDNLFFLQTGGETKNELPLRADIVRLPDGLNLPNGILPNTPQ
ncbi:DUF3472 domain-containing protein [bacterium]|nr:DUF3472 domain-containing protein [bacterium]